MAFLTWTNKKEAEDSLAAINDMYGCPYVAENGYRMDRWDNVIVSRDGAQWGFFKPKARIGKQQVDLMSALTPGFVEQASKPVEFYPEDEESDTGELN